MAQPTDVDIAPVEPTVAPAAATPVTALSGEDLDAAIRLKASQNENLSMRERDLMVKLYDMFRTDIVAAMSDGGEHLSAVFWIRFIADMMSVVKSFKREGAQKKAMIMETLHIIIEHDVAESARDDVLSLVDTFAPPAIDMAVAFWHQVAPRAWNILTCGPCRKPKTDSS